jgi:hypothetical protein
MSIREVVMNTNLVIIPSRGRPQNVQRSFNAIKETSVISDLVFVLDKDDEHNYPRIPGASYEVLPRIKMNKSLNAIALKNIYTYKTITFMGDDHLTQTSNWDEVLYAPIKDRGFGLSYGNDSLQGKDLPTAVMMSTNLIKILGFMAPHDLLHLYMDYFWLDLGRELNAIDYFECVDIKHLHYSNTEGTWDQTYEEANSSFTVNEDYTVYEKYKKECFSEDASRIRKLLT